MTLDLHVLTADQPAQPPDRLGAVLRRSRRVRRTRAVLAVAAVVALVAPLGLLATRAEPRATSFAQTRVDRWPDRSLTADRGVADGALAAFRSLAVPDGHTVDPAPPRWLYRGTVPVPDGNDAYVAVFLTRQDGAPVVVTSSTRRGQVDDHGRDVGAPGDGSSVPWVARVQPVTPDLDHVGLYLGFQGREAVLEPVTGVPQADVRDVLFVLADPAARRLDWTQQPLPHAEEATGRTFSPGGTLSSPDGVFTGDAGSLGGPVSVALTDARGRVRPAGPLSPVATADLAPPAVPAVPAGWVQRFAASGGSERQADGSWSGPASLGLSDEVRGGTGAVVGRCYGGGVLQVRVEDGQGHQAGRGSLACDGQSHLAVRQTVPLREATVHVRPPDRQVCLQLLVGTLPAR